MAYAQMQTNHTDGLQLFILQKNYILLLKTTA